MTIFYIYIKCHIDSAISFANTPHYIFIYPSKNDFPSFAEIDDGQLFWGGYILMTGAGVAVGGRDCSGTTIYFNSTLKLI